MRICAILAALAVAGAAMPASAEQRKGATLDVERADNDEPVIVHEGIRAEHHRQAPRLPGKGDALRDLRMPERNAVEEPEGRDRLVEAGPRDPLRDQVDLEGADILQFETLRGAPEEPAEITSVKVVEIGKWSGASSIRPPVLGIER